MMLPRPAATDPLSIKSLGGSVCSAEHATDAASRRTALVSLSIQTDASRHSPLCRKLLHISPGLLAFLLPLLPHTKPLSTQALVEITVITSLLTGLYIALRRYVERPREHDFYLTTLSYPAAILGTLFAFPAAPELAAVVLVVIAFGDGSAWLAGTRIGGRRLPWNRDKTWAGSIAFAAVGGTLATLAYHGEADLGTSWLAASLCGGGAALVAALVESLPVRLSDNVRVGLVAAVTVALLHFLVIPAWPGIA